MQFTDTAQRQARTCIYQTRCCSSLCAEARKCFCSICGAAPNKDVTEPAAVSIPRPPKAKQCLRLEAQVPLSVFPSCLHHIVWLKVPSALQRHITCVRHPHHTSIRRPGCGNETAALLSVQHAPRLTTHMECQRREMLKQGQCISIVST